MDLTQLTYFLKVAERGTFTAAAEELMLSQPALSRSIARLEEELGQPLFERQTRQVTLTDAGRLFLPRARQILALIENTRCELQDDGQSGRLRLGVIPTIAPYFLPGLLRTFADEYPRAAVIVREDTTDRLLKQANEGEIDLALLALPVAAGYLQVEELFAEELLLVLPAEHPLAEKKRLTLKDVEPWPFVLLDEAHCLTDNIVSFCRQRSFQPVSVERTSQLVTVQELVALNHGVSMIPAMARRQDQNGQRVYRSLSSPTPTRTIAIAWNADRYQSRLLSSFRELLRSTCR